MTTIYKAQPVGTQVIPDLDLRATEPVSDQTSIADHKLTWEKNYRDFYTAQGKNIADALCASLPGGTLDALLVEMLDRRRSLLKVRA